MKTDELLDRWQHQRVLGGRNAFDYDGLRRCREGRGAQAHWVNDLPRDASLRDCLVACRVDPDRVRYGSELRADDFRVREEQVDPDSFL